jgi:LysM repeat protein
VAAVGVAAAATAIAGGFNGVGQRPAAGGAESTPTLTQQPTMLATLEPSNRPTDQPTQQPTSEPTRRPRNSASAAPEPVTYVVKAGDTLTQIASQFGTSVQAIKDANGLGSDVINVGQVLVIP